MTMIELNSVSEYPVFIASKQNIIFFFYASYSQESNKLNLLLKKTLNFHKNIILVKGNIENFNDLAYEQNINIIPTLIFYKDGLKCHTLVNSTTQTKLHNQIYETYKPQDSYYFVAIFSLMIICALAILFKYFIKK